MKKRILTLALALLMLVSLVPMGVLAVDDYGYRLSTGTTINLVAGQENTIDLYFEDVHGTISTDGGQTIDFAIFSAELLMDPTMFEEWNITDFVDLQNTGVSLALTTGKTRLSMIKLSAITYDLTQPLLRIKVTPLASKIGETTTFIHEESTAYSVGYVTEYFPKAEVFTATIVAPSVDDTVTAVNVSGSTTIKMGSTAQLTAAVTPAMGTNEGITWTRVSGNGSISSTGLVSLTGPAAVGNTIVVRATSTHTPAVFKDHTLTVVAADAITAEDKHIQFKYALQSRTRSIVTSNTVTEIYPGEVYTMNVYLNDLANFGAIAIPLKFNNAAIEITGITPGAAYTSAFEPTYSIAGSDVTEGIKSYEAFNNDFSLADVNKDGQFLLTFSKKDGNDITLSDLSDPSTSASTHHFFTITFAVKTDDPDSLLPTVIGQKTNFQPTTAFGTMASDLAILNGTGRDVIVFHGLNGLDDVAPTYLKTTVNMNPTICEKSLEIILPDDDGDYEMNLSDVSVGLTALPEGSAAVTGGAFDWTVLAPDGTTDVTSTTITAGQGTLMPTFKPAEGGDYTVTVISRVDPSLKDTIIITVKTTLTISGYAKLSAKYRGATISEYPYTPDLQIMDQGIKVELVKLATTSPVAAEKVIGDAVYTQRGSFTKGTKLCNFTLPVPEEVVADGLNKYMVRLTRIGFPVGTVTPDNIREESYLCAEMSFAAGAVSANADVVVDKDIYLIAGAFVAPGATKIGLTNNDVNTLKALVGTLQGQQSEIYDINEYAGIDAGDLLNVRKLVSKTKAHTGILTITGNNGALATSN